MKVAVISDTHLGFKFGTERGEDAFRNAREAFERAVAEKVDMVLLPGDIFHNKIPKPEVMNRAMDLFSILKRIPPIKIINYKNKDNEESMNKKIPSVVSIFGTHEKRNREKINPVHLLETAGLLTYLHAESVLLEAAGERIGIHGLSGVPEEFAKSAMDSWKLKPFPGVINILMIHQSFRELIPQIDKDIMTYADLPKGIDLFLLGHIHWTVEDKHPLTNSKILVCGSTIRTQLRKIEAKKGKFFHLINTKDNSIKIEKKELEKVRGFYYNELNVNGKKPSEVVSQSQEKISTLIKYHMGKLKPLIRFKISGSLAEGFLPTDLNFGLLKKKFKDKALLYFDRTKVQSSKLSKRSKILYDLKQKNISVEEIGIQLLIKNMNVNTPEGVERVKKTFEKLVNGEGL